MKKPFLIAITIIGFISLSLAQPCLPDGIEFTSQEQIDNFQTDYPDCDEIQGDVGIYGYDINNLNGLNLLNSIGGNLNIGNYAYNNVSLTDFTGLDNLTIIGGDLNIIDNDALLNLIGLKALTSIGGMLKINENYALTNLTGLTNLISIGNDLDVSGHKSLTSLTGLENLDSIEGYIYITGNSSLINLSGLDSLISIGESLNIFSNGILTDLTGLNNLINIGWDLNIQHNASLTSLSGLDNLTTIGDFITIHDNLNLTNLSVLNNLISVGSFLAIIKNYSLNDLTGLDNIDAGSISDLYIYNNYSLATCEVQSVCNYLLNPTGTVEIYGNASGCNSPEEVKEACLVSVNEPFSLTNVSVFPNPFTNYTAIKYNLTNPQRVALTIFNHLGKQVDLIRQHQLAGKQSLTWQPQGLPPGMYYFTLQAGDQVSTGKMVMGR